MPAHTAEDICSLVERAQGGDEEAYGQLYDHFRPVVLGFVRARTYPSTLRWVQPEDLVQQVMAEVLRGLHGMSLEGAHEELPIRLKRVAFERICDAGRRSARLQGSSIAPGSRSGLLALEAGQSEGVVTRADGQELLERMIEALPGPYDEVLRMHVLERRNFEQIGVRQGISADAAYRRYQKAAALIRARCSHDG